MPEVVLRASDLVEGALKGTLDHLSVSGAYGSNGPAPGTLHLYMLDASGISDCVGNTSWLSTTQPLAISLDVCPHLGGGSFEPTLRRAASSSGVGNPWLILYCSRSLVTAPPTAPSIFSTTTCGSCMGPTD